MIFLIQLMVAFQLQKSFDSEQMPPAGIIYFLSTLSIFLHMLQVSYHLKNDAVDNNRILFAIYQSFLQRLSKIRLSNLLAEAMCISATYHIVPYWQLSC